MSGYGCSIHEGGSHWAVEQWYVYDYCVGVIKTEGELNLRLSPGMYQMDLDTLKESVGTFSRSSGEVESYGTV